MTRRSSAPTPHCVRRGRGCLGNQWLRFAQRGPSASPRRDAPALIGQPHFNEMACVAFAVQSRSLPRLHSQQRGNAESGGGGKRESETALRAQRGNNESGNGDNRKNGTQPVAAMQRRVGERSKPRKRKCGGGFYEPGIGARSAAGGMTALSLRWSVRGDRFQMHHYRDCAGDPLKN